MNITLMLIAGVLMSCAGRNQSEYVSQVASDTSPSSDSIYQELKALFPHGKKLGEGYEVNGSTYVGENDSLWGFTIKSPKSGESDLIMKIYRKGKFQKISYQSQKELTEKITYSHVAKEGGFIVDSKVLYEITAFRNVSNGIVKKIVVGNDYLPNIPFSGHTYWTILSK